jgi:2'-5' RNA ligase
VPAIARAFVAVELPVAVHDAIAARVHAVQDAAPGAAGRFATAWHVTLQFLGRVDDAEGLTAALAAALGGIPPAELRLGGGGAFPRARRGTLLWLGVDVGADALVGLAAAVSRATEPLGFAAETRPFRPHITLARFRAPRDLRPLVAAIGTTPVGPAWRVDEVALLASETLPEGARHTEVSRIPLAR